MAVISIHYGQYSIFSVYWSAVFKSSIFLTCNNLKQYLYHEPMNMVHGIQ